MSGGGRRGGLVLRHLFAALRLLGEDVSEQERTGYDRSKMRSLLEVAQELAEAHREEDPATTEVYLAESPYEIRLVEVSGSVSSIGTKEVLPFWFTERPDQGIDYPSVVILLSPEEWESVERGEISLPQGWDKRALKKIA